MADEESKRVVSAIEPTRVQLREVWRNDWVANAPQGVTPDDIKAPAFWAHRAMDFKPYDRLEVRAEDGSWVADCIVAGCARTWAKVKVLAVHKLENVEEAMKHSADFEVAFKGPHKKWSVIRTKDGAYIKEGLGTRDEADAWLRDHQRNLAA